jgi:putative solute:sodium symporter small subunit
MSLTERQRIHWQKNLRLTVLLLVIWCLFTFVIPWFARELNTIDFIGPLGFYLTAQGALLVYVLIVWFYARRMNRLDAEYGVPEERDG